MYSQGLHLKAEKQKACTSVEFRQNGVDTDYVEEVRHHKLTRASKKAETALIKAQEANATLQFIGKTVIDQTKASRIQLTKAKTSF